MRRTQSDPGLGKDRPPLHAYAGDSLLSFSPEEEESERIYYAVVSSSLSKRAFTVLAKDLNRRSPDAGAYLAWLIYRGWKWPTVAAAKGKCDVSSCLRALARSVWPSRSDWDGRL